MNALTIYLAGEIHAPWREDLRRSVAEKDLDVEITWVGPQEVHDRSDDIGEAVLGEQSSERYRDLLGGQINNLRRLVQLVIAYIFE